jgi:hypothetical protein
MTTQHIPSGYTQTSWTAELVHAVRECYADWREREDAVADAYGQWSAASADEEAVRFSAYVAALDQEAAAAGVYARSIQELGRMTQRN